MEAFQVISSATQLVSSTIGAVGALEQASRNLDEALKRIRNLEEFVSELEIENLAHRAKQKHAYKLHSTHLDHQIHVEEWHESVFTTLMSLIKAGKLRAVKKMFDSEINKSLIKLLESGSEVAQHQAIVTPKATYELGESLRPSSLNLLPWQARVKLEKFVQSDRNTSPSPKPQTFEYLIHEVVDSNNKQVIKEMQDLIPIIEKAGDPIIRDMILRSPLIKRLSELLQKGNPEQNSMRSGSAFTLTKLACSWGEPCIKKFLEHYVVPELVKMMQCNVAELQDSAYTALHQMLFGKVGVLILDQILQNGPH